MIIGSHDRMSCLFNRDSTWVHGEASVAFLEKNMIMSRNIKGEIYRPLSYLIKWAEL